MATFESTKTLQHLPQPSSLLYNRKKPWWHQIQDPNGEFVTKWNQIFLITSLIALFIDPLFFYLPRMKYSFESYCMGLPSYDVKLMVFFRSIVDVYSALHVAMKFRTAYVSKNSRVFGKGDLVINPKMIAIRYIKTDFIIDFAAALPLPQIVLWSILPKWGAPTAAHASHSISLVIILQYIPRLFVIFPLNKQIIKNTGVVAKTAWSGAAYNLLIYLLASHVVGASWYLMAFERYYNCLKQECKAEQDKGSVCVYEFLDCQYLHNETRFIWARTTELFQHCNAKTTPNNYDFGMFANVDNDKVTQADFLQTCFYCLWWGLSSLSSYGQTADTSTSVVETLFASLICLVGLVFFALLIGNMQTYLQSMTARLEEWRVKRRDTEEWMRHRQLPPDLQERVRRFVQYKWLATRGVDEEEILHSLPMDLRRQIQRHLCLALVRRVPFFSQMDDQLLDAICERLVSSLNVKDMYIVREGDPVNEMLFIIRGQLESSTTNGGRSGFFNSITLKNGDFCGEELLTWALMPTSSLNLPLSTRTVKSLTEVEAFALRAEDLKFVANQFKRLHNKKLQHAFRYYSHQWRTWGACFIQTAWRRFKRKKLADELAKHESMYDMQLGDQESNYYDDLTGTGEEDSGAGSSGHNLTTTILASRFAANTRRGVAQKLSVLHPDGSSTMPKKLLKPDDPDFSADH